MSVSSGLVARYKMQDEGAVATDSKNDHDIPLVNTDWVDGGLRVNASGEYGTWDNTGQQLFGSDAGSVIFWVEPLSAFNDSAAHRFFGGADASGYIYCEKRSDNELRFAFNNLITTRYIGLYAALVPNWDTGICLALQWDKNSNLFDNKKIAAAVDGAYVVPSASSNADALDTYDIPTSLRFANHHSDVGRFLNAVIERCYVFSEPKTESELLRIYNNPGIVNGANSNYYYQA